MGIKQIMVQELKEKRDRKESFKLIDCREPDEYEVCQIEGSLLIPLSQFAERAPKELKMDEEIVIHCHHGGRSQRACEHLARLGYQNVANVVGGIHAWSVEVDPGVQQY